MPASPEPKASEPVAKKQRPNPPGQSSVSPDKKDGPAATQGLVKPVPIEQPALPPAAPQGVPPLQNQFPNMSKVADHQDARIELVKLISFVTTNMQKIVNETPNLSRQFPNVQPWQQKPLPIQEETSVGNGNRMNSYKFAWTAESARSSLISTGMFEASGNGLWCNPHPPQDIDHQRMAGEPITWGGVKQIADDFFTMARIQTVSADVSDRQDFDGDV